MKIYTKTGDRGETGLIGGARVSKDDLAIEAFGELDELNSAVGFARAACVDWPLDLLLKRVQSLIFEVGAEAASPENHRRSYGAKLGSITEDLERSMDLQTEMLPKLEHFVLPGGSERAARLHLARCQCRRAERRLVALSRVSPVRPEILAFVNRLSDWLFLAARTANHEAKAPETIWLPQD